MIYSCVILGDYRLSTKLMSCKFTHCLNESDVLLYLYKMQLIIIILNTVKNINNIVNTEVSRRENAFSWNHAGSAMWYPIIVLQKIISNFLPVQEHRWLLIISLYSSTKIDTPSASNDYKDHNKIFELTEAFGFQYLF